MIKLIIKALIVIAGISLVLAGREFFYYAGAYTPPPTETPRYEHIAVLPAPITAFSENVSAEVSDNLSDNMSKIVLIDLAHGNKFEIEELNVLSLRLISRGLSVKFFAEKEDLKRELLGEEEKAAPKPADKAKEVTEKEKVEKPTEPTEKKELEKPPKAFVVVCPGEEFSSEEKKTIHKFIDRGGKLLLIADPTRHSKMNSLALDFSLIFEPDYLYNQKEYETNYQNIFITEFKENEITRNLNKLVLYTAGSISSAEPGIAFVDENTRSSIIESRKGLAPMVLADKSKILAIHDLTFLTEPYSSSLDNNQLISNIADWLASPAKP